MKKTLKILAVCILAVMVVLLCWWAIPKIMSLTDEAVRVQLKEKLSSMGIWGGIVMLFIQILQVFVAVLPGEPVEIVNGYLYGTVGGLCVCLAGLFIGSFLVFLCVEKLGMKFVNKFVNSKGFEKLKFLRDPLKRDSMLFLLFMIPGTPKDVLVYFAPFTRIPLWRFLLLSTFARIPSVLSSTFIGANLYQEDYFMAIVVFLLTGILGLLGIYINSIIMKKYNKKSNVNSNDDE